MFTSGIVKHVYQEEASEEQVKEHILETYPVSDVELFKRNGNFTGTMKITFKTRKDLLDAMENRIKIFQQRYMVEEFKPVPRVIKCHRCQAFGHISSRCRSNHPNCGKCGEKDHETKDCVSNVLKCAHCNQKHITGDKSCKVIIAKLEEIKSRAQYGY